MEFRDLKKQYQLHKKEINSAIQSVLVEADFIQGKQVRQLEEALVEYVGVKYCITCANGTDALQLALMTWDVGKGDAVFVPDLTFFSSAEVAALAGATPVFVDIEEVTYNMNPESLEAAVKYVIQHTSLRPKVIVAVDLFGQPADYEQIRQIADRYGLFILEDSAQGFGGRIGEKRCGSFGDIATTSFFPAKPLGCYGDGGAVFTNNAEWAELLCSYRVHGKGKDKYENIRIGMNSRLDTLQAAILLEKMKFFDDEIKKCDQAANEYAKQLKDFVKVPIVKEGMYSSWAQYTVCFSENGEREQVVKNLKEQNIPAAVYYRRPMHLQKAFAGYEFDRLDYSITEKICSRCLSLPMHPYLDRDDIFRVTKIIVQTIKGCAK